MGIEQTLTKSLEEHASAIKSFTDTVSEKQAELSARLLDLEQRAAGGGEGGPIGGTSNFLDAITKSDRLAAVMGGQPHSGRIEIAGRLPHLIKALTNVGFDGVGDTTSPTQPERAQGLYNDPRAPLSLLEVLPSVPFGTSALEYPTLDDAFDDAADYQLLEGAEKPETAIDVGLQSAYIATIAHWTRTSKQVLADSALLQVQIANLMRYRVLRKADSELLLGTGVGKRIKGLVTASTLAVTTADKPADRIGEAAVLLEDAGWMPSLVIMNPADWFGISAERSELDGQYVGTGWQQPERPTIWSLPRVTSQWMPVGEALVLDKNHVQVLDREQAAIFVSTEDRDNFIKNLVTILGEVRLGLVLYAPLSILRVDLAPTP